MHKIQLFGLDHEGRIFMVCDCCGKKKKLFDMFYSVGSDGGKINFCGDCWDVVERLESDAASGEKELYEMHLFQLRKKAKNPTPEFLSWQSVHFPQK